MNKRLKTRKSVAHVAKPVRKRAKSVRSASKKTVKEKAVRKTTRKIVKRVTKRTAVKKGFVKKAPVQKKVVKKKGAAPKSAVKKLPADRKAALKPKEVKIPKPKAGGVASQAKTTTLLKKRGAVKKVAPRGKTKSVSRAVSALRAVVPRSMAVVASGVTGSAGADARTMGTLLPQGAGMRASSRKPRLLWIGDALVPTGFATVTHAVLNDLRHDWEVIVSGVNYDGAPHDLPYHVMPAWQGGDMWGINRFQHLCAEFAPAAVVINNDWWNVAKFAKIAPAGVPIIGYMPVDGGNLDPASMRELNRIHAAVWYTNYGFREAKKAGFAGRRHVIPHGIDGSVFEPMNRGEARHLLDLNVPRDSFIVGNLNRNQPRKRLDLTVHIFADWIRQHRVSDAYLLLHCANKDTGWDLTRVASFHGVADRLILTGSDDIRDLQDARHLRLIYNSLDVQVSTTLGEGWGLTTMEGMACGIPQIVPDSSALAEWAAPAVKIPCSRLLMNPEINTIGALVDHGPFVDALQSLYRNAELRARLAEQGVAHARRTGFRWENVAARFSALLASALRKKSLKRAALV